ncbi:hypothetical protein BV22DRAFT_1132522 [Leucogyrophana mollusca]|uniref:Uncharacterized protein n=1 Tax=Leucogyrophana mollusca TaxID=85980 RepID=A0ACB8B5V2_9AGAM|nr:hypothetical protein BV22DRAFT_1132522 [Leucogyrophana mollusca]
MSSSKASSLEPLTPTPGSPVPSLPGGTPSSPPMPPLDPLYPSPNDTDDDGPPHVPTPLWVSLLSCCAARNAISPEHLADVPSDNNPRPLRSQMGDNAEYWVTGSDHAFQFRFPAILDTKGQYSRCGEYFSLPETGLDLGAIKKAKVQFELRPLSESTCFPPQAIKTSNCALETLFALQAEVEEVRNKLLSERTKAPNVIPFWRTYKAEDRYVLVVHSEALFKDLPNTRNDSGPRLSRADIGKNSVMLSPSKVKSSSKSAASASGASTSATSKNSITQLPDPQGRYAGVIAQLGLGSAKVNPPDVRDGMGALIHPRNYPDALPDGAVVDVEVFLKLWNIRGSGDMASRDPHGSRIYQVMLKSMKILPDYTLDPDMVLGKGKRKATDDLSIDQSPAKKASSSATGSFGDPFAMEDVEA